MKGIVLRWLVLTLAIMVAAYLIEGIEVRGFGSALFAAAILGILNAFFRPVLIILTLPINILGFFHVRDQCSPAHDGLGCDRGIRSSRLLGSFFRVSDHQPHQLASEFFY